MSSTGIHSLASQGPLPRPWDSETPESAVHDEFVESPKHKASRKSTESSTARTDSTQPTSDDDDMDDSSSVDLLVGRGQSSHGTLAVTPTPPSTSPPTASYEALGLISGSTTASEAAEVGAGPDSDSSTASDDSFSLEPSRQRR